MGKVPLEGGGVFLLLCRTLHCLLHPCLSPSSDIMVEGLGADFGAEKLGKCLPHLQFGGWDAGACVWGLGLRVHGGGVIYRAVCCVFHPPGFRE